MKTLILNGSPKGKRGYYDPEFGLTDELYCKAKIQSYLELFED